MEEARGLIITLLITAIYVVVSYVRLDVIVAV